MEYLSINGTISAGTNVSGLLRAVEEDLFDYALKFERKFRLAFPNLPLTSQMADAEFFAERQISPYLSEESRHLTIVPYFETSHMGTSYCAWVYFNNEGLESIVLPEDKNPFSAIL